MSEKILSSKRIYSGRIVTLDLCEVELPDGQHQMREIIRHPGATALIALDDQSRLLLVRQYRSASAEMMVEIPAGVLDAGEQPIEAAIRELQEETGFRPGKIEPLGDFFVAPGYTTEHIHIFVATDLVESRLPADEDEFIELQRVALSDALDMIDKGEIRDAKTMIGIQMYARRLKQS